MNKNLLFVILAVAGWFGVIILLHVIDNKNITKPDQNTIINDTLIDTTKIYNYEINQ